MVDNGPVVGPSSLVSVVFGIGDPLSFSASAPLLVCFALLFSSESPATATNKKIKKMM